MSAAHCYAITLSESSINMAALSYASHNAGLKLQPPLTRMKEQCKSITPNEYGAHLP